MSSDQSNAPRRLILGGKRHGPILIYGDDMECIGQGRIAVAPPPDGYPFLREDIAKRMLGALKLGFCALTGPAITEADRRAAITEMGDAIAAAQSAMEAGE